MFTGWYIFDSVIWFITTRLAQCILYAWLALYVRIYCSDGLSNTQQIFYKNTTFSKSLFLYLFLFWIFIFICVLTAFFLSRKQIYIVFTIQGVCAHRSRFASIWILLSGTCVGKQNVKKKTIHPDCALVWWVFIFHSLSYECEYTSHIFYCKVPVTSWLS